MTGSLRSSRRPLTPAERRFIKTKIQSLAARGRRTSKAYLPIAAGVFLVLWLWTVAASDVSWLIVTAFWLVIGSAITLWVRRDMRKDAGHLYDMANRLESALRRNAADVYDVRASAFAEFEEIEDEGACYVFEIERGRVVFVVGQEFYEGAKFPSLDFSLVYILDEQNDTVDMLIEKRGAKARPARTIPAAVKEAREIPEHLEVRTGRITDVEAILDRRPV